MKIYVRSVKTRILCMVISREGPLSSKCFPTAGIPLFGAHRLEKLRQVEKKWWWRESEGGTQGSCGAERHEQAEADREDKGVRPRHTPPDSPCPPSTSRGGSLKFGKS